MIHWIEDFSHKTGIDRGIHVVTGGKRCFDRDGTYNRELAHQAFQNALSAIEILGCTSGNVEVAGCRPRLVAHLHPGSDGTVSMNAIPVLVNAERGTPFETDTFKGEMLFLHRRAGGRNGHGFGPSPYEQHLSDCKREFEVRVQGVYKKVPRFPHLSAEVVNHLGLSYSASIFLNALGKFASTLSATTLFNFDNETDSCHNAMRPYWATPAYHVHVFARTLAGEKPPLITEPFAEMTDQDKFEAFQNMEDGDVVTIVFGDMHCSFMEWGFVNMPLGLDSTWSNIIGDQSVHITMYDLVGSLEEPHGLHSQAHKQYVFSLICSLAGCENSEKSEGPASRNTATCGAFLEKYHEALRKFCSL